MYKKFVITVQIDQKGREQLDKFNQKVIIVRNFLESPTYPIACIAFTPFGINNVIEFYPEYYIYASNGQFIPNQIIDMQIQTDIPVNGGEVYSFNGTNIAPLKNGYPHNIYAVENGSDKSGELTFGLAQKIDNLVNNKTDLIIPICSEVVPYNETVRFCPVDRIKVFIASGVTDSQVIYPLDILNTDEYSQQEFSMPIIGKSLTVDFGSNPSQVIHYDDTTNLFVLGSLPS